MIGHSKEVGMQKVIEARKKEKGFTLVEIMITLVILGIAMTAIYQMFIQQQRAYLIQEDISETQQNIRVAMEMMAGELRRAGADVPNTVIPLCPAVPACTNSNPDSITFSITSGNSTFITPTGAGGIIADANNIYVQNRSDFIGGGIVNIIRPISKELINTHEINGSSSGPDALQVDNGSGVGFPLDPTILKEGDMVVTVPFTVTYNLVGSTLMRNGVPLAENIQDLQISYISDLGVETDAPPANSLDIRAVRITITSNTTREVSELSGAARDRQLSTVVKVRNLDI